MSKIQAETVQAEMQTSATSPDFRTAYKRPKPLPCPPGKPVYEYEYMLDGEVVKEEWQIHEQIQSYHDDCTVSAIMARYNKTGDPSLLNSRKGHYGDFSDLPQDLTEYHEGLKAAEAMLQAETPPTEEKPDETKTPETTAKESENNEQDK